MKSRRLLVSFSVCLLVFLTSAARAAEPAKIIKTALDEYVAKPDPSYSWKLVKTIPGDGVTTFVLDLKSQTWRASPEVDRAVWQHWVVITKPEQVKHEIGYLMIGGGRNGGQPPDKANAQSSIVAKATGSAVIDLGQIPNQPLVLNGDGQQRSEDDLIAYGWVKYMDTGDATWIPRFPMVKAAVRCMDAVTEFLASEAGGKVAVKKYVVAGGSKRGWTTWLTGAVDSRVVAVVPAVIDVLNVKAASINHYSAYGFWAPALGDYSKHKIHDRFDTPQYDELLKIEDPYAYRARLTMPKFVVNSAGDQYFPPDSSKFYYDDLPGVKYLRYVPNTNHSLGGSDALESIMAFYNGILTGSKLPRFSWKMQPDGSIRVETADRPLEVNVWQATNPKARDFRLMTIDKAYKKSALASQTDGTYLAKVDKPAEGWTAFFVELTFAGSADGSAKVPYKFTTQVSIVPDKLPYNFEEYRRNLKKN